MHKVFGIGFHKTGTTTLDTALQVLGYNAAPVRTDLIKSLSKNNMEPTLKVARTFDAFQDNPWPIIYNEMYKEFPDSKFVLTVRESEKWIKSIVNSFGGKSTLMREWIYGSGKGDPRNNEQLFLDMYVRHNEQVRDFFSDKADSFLEINWETAVGWEELCEFLGKEIPGVEFPHANKGQYGEIKKRKFRMFRK